MIVKNTKEYFVGFLGRIKNKGYKVELKEMIKVMQHYDNGGEVEFKYTNDYSDKWDKDNEPCWDWSIFNYRIKEQKQKVIIEKWLCSDNQGGLVVIETTNIEEYTYITKKLKLIESYEVEL